MKEIKFITDLEIKDEYICDDCHDTHIVPKGKGIEVCKRCLNAGRLNQ